MSELTEEQIMIREQWRIAADQFFREGLFSVSQKVNQGVYDSYVLEVGKQYYKSFREANFPKGNPNESK
jgi:hypothetical protein